MGFDPLTVGNKTQGDIIQSSDWNALVDEVVAVNTRNVSRTGDALTGPLSFGNTPTPALYLFEADGTGVSRPFIAKSPTSANWGLRYDDNGNRLHFQRAGAPVLTTDLNAERVGIKNGTPSATLDVAGGVWNVDATEGDLRIGNDTHRLKFGIATAGGGAGIARIRAQGGQARLLIGGGNDDTLSVTQSGVGVGLNAATTPYTTLAVNGSIGVTNGTFPVLYIQQSGGSNERAVIAHSPAFPDWGLWYEDATDAFVFKGSGNDRVRIDLSPADTGAGTGGYLVIGDTNGSNLSLDTNEIQARNNGLKSTLFLNSIGGDVRISSTRFTVTDGGYVGIGDTSPLAPLHIATNGGDTSLTTHGYMLIGQPNGSNISIDPNEIMARNNGAAATLYLQHEGGNVFVANGSGSGTLRVGTNGKFIQMRNTGTQLDIDVSSGDNLYINNTGTGDVFIRNRRDISTRTIKDGIFNLTTQDAYDLLANLSPVGFHYKDDANKRVELGFIAEDAPDVIATDDHKAISYQGIVATLTGVVRDQAARIDDLTAELARIRRMMEQD